MGGEGGGVLDGNGEGVSVRDGGVASACRGWTGRMRCDAGI
jgi:hypothetical protein